jgi:hypothetical protein
VSGDSEVTYTFTITRKATGLFEITMSDGAKSKTMSVPASQVIKLAPTVEAHKLLALEVGASTIVVKEL